MAAELLVELSALVPDVATLSAALARMDRVLVTILETTSTAVRVVDVSGRIVRANEPALAGHAAPHPASIRELWERDQPHRAADRAVLGFLDTPGMRALGGLVIRGELLAIRSRTSGETCMIECSASPVFGDDGKVIGAVLIDREVSDERRSQEPGEGPEPRAVARVSPERPSNVESQEATRSVSGLIHDVNNALNTIMAAAFLVQHRAESHEAVRDYAGRIQQAAESGAAAAAHVERMVREASKPTDNTPRALAGVSVKQISPLMPVIAGPLDILLVEDNEDGREYITRLLRTEGHRVQAVATGTEARLRLESTSSVALDLLLTDLDLPDGNGWELAAYARQQRSSLRIGVISGWDAGIGGDESVSAEFVLRKPLRAEVLLDHVAGRQAPALPE